jgi:hypothetical protein
MTILISNVTCLQEFTNEIPSLFCLNITNELKLKILDLSAVVKSTGANEISIFINTPCWAAIEFADLDYETDISEMIPRLMKNPFLVQYTLMHISSDSVRWSSVPQGHGDAYELRTDIFSIDDISKGALVKSSYGEKQYIESINYCQTKLTA